MSDWHKDISDTSLNWDSYIDAIKGLSDVEQRERLTREYLHQVIASIDHGIVTLANGVKEETDILKNDLSDLKEKHSLFLRWFIFVSILFFILLSAIIWKIFGASA